MPGSPLLVAGRKIRNRFEPDCYGDAEGDQQHQATHEDCDAAGIQAGQPSKADDAHDQEQRRQEQRTQTEALPEDGPNDPAEGAGERYRKERQSEKDSHRQGENRS